MTVPYAIRNLGVTAYFKPAVGMRLLREIVLGKERLDKAFNYYVIHERSNTRLHGISSTVWKRYR